VSVPNIRRDSLSHAVLEVNHNGIAGVHAQVGRLPAAIVHEAIPYTAVRLRRVQSGKGDLENAVRASHVRRLQDDAANLRPRACFPERDLGIELETAQCDQQDAEEQGPLCESASP
jgi:hypothetical protein